METDAIYRISAVETDEVVLALVGDDEVVINLTKASFEADSPVTAAIGDEYRALADEGVVVIELRARRVKIVGTWQPAVGIAVEDRHATTALEFVIDPPLTQSEFDSLKNKEFCALLTNAGELEWRIEGDQALEDWRAERQRVAAAEKERLRKKARAKRIDRLFVNPYTFVPLRTGPEKSEPVGHSLLTGETVCGSLEVAWSVETPLMCGVDRREPSTSGEEGADKVVTFAEGADGCVVPGSSIKGAVRALHEAIANGCMRVLDTSFVPVYREHASPEHRRGYVLGYIEDVADGRPTQIRLSGEVRWVRARDLRAARPDEDRAVKSGQSYAITGKVVAPHGRPQFDGLQIRSKSGEPAQGDHTILVAATNSARDKSPFWCATGELSDSVLGVSDTGWSDFLYLVEGATDCEPGGRVEEKVNHAREGLIGTALGPSRVFAKGQVVWVKPNPGRTAVEEISLSALWRSKGSGNVGHRARAHAPCQSWEALCPSCQIFGAAETAGSDHDGQQKSYQAHVRFGEGRMETAAGSPLQRSDLDQAVQLAPLLSPRPGSGQFYLQNRPSSQHANRGEVPLRQWGSAADSAQRPIRGRKFYWHGDPDVQKVARGLNKPRHLLRGQSDTTTKRVDLARPGAVVRSTIHFEGLTRAQIGSLLMAINPGLAFGSDLRTRLGGGKPLGLGTVKPSIEQITASTAAGRYIGSHTAGMPSPVGLVDEFKQSASDSVRAGWPDIEAILRPDPEKTESIWYPPGTTWNNANSEKFDQSYEFFGNSDGAYVSDDKRDPEHKRELVTLPAPRDRNQDLPINPSIEDETWWRDKQ